VGAGVETKLSEIKKFRNAGYGGAGSERNYDIGIMGVMESKRLFDIASAAMSIKTWEADMGCNN